MKKKYAAKEIEKILSLGRQKGFLTYDEVNDLLPQDLSSTEDIDRLFELLGNEDIEVVEREGEKPAQKASLLVKEEKEEAPGEQLKAEERFLPF